MNMRINKDKIWIKEDGSQIHIEDMSDKHLDNTIKMIKKKATGFALQSLMSSMTRPEYERLLRNRKLSRILNIDDESNYLVIWEKHVTPIFWEMVYEKRKRENLLFR